MLSCRDPRFQLEPGTEVVSIDERYFRPTEVDLLIGDASKAKNKLGWEPEFSLEELITEMVTSDLREVEKERYIGQGGFSLKNYYE